MAKKMQAVRLTNFTGGEVSVFPATTMNPTFSKELENVYVWDNGAIRTTPPSTRIVEKAGCVTGAVYTKLDGSQFILFTTATKLFRYDGAGGSTELANLSKGECNFSTMNNLFFITNGVDTPKKYNGATVSPATGMPITTFKTHIHKGRMWAIEKTNKLLASCSALNDPADWTKVDDAGYIDFQAVLSVGDELLDIASFNNQIVFFFRNHIAAYSGQKPAGADADFALTRLLSGVGVFATGTIQNLGTDLVFAHHTGVKSLSQVMNTGDLNIKNISENVGSEIPALTRYADFVSSTHYPLLGMYILNIEGSLFVYRYAAKAWSRLSLGNVLGMFSDSAGNVYYCTDDGLYRYGLGTIQQPFNWVTAEIPLSKNGNDVFPKSLKIWADTLDESGVPLNVQWAFNGGAYSNATQVTLTGSPTIIDNILDWDAVTDFDGQSGSFVNIPLFGAGSTIRFQIQGAPQNELVFNQLLMTGEVSEN